MTNEERNSMEPNGLSYQIGAKRPMPAHQYTKLLQLLKNLNEGGEVILSFSNFVEDDEIESIHLQREAEGFSMALFFNMEEFDWDEPLVLAASVLPESLAMEILTKLALEGVPSGEIEIIGNSFRKIDVEDAKDLSGAVSEAIEHAKKREDTDMNAIFKQMQDAVMMMDADRLPEMHRCLIHFLAENEMPDAYEMANEIRQCDLAEDLPDCLFDLLVEIYGYAIARGNADAMNDLGALYYEGRGREPDYKKAVRLYEMAALNGSRQAQENLGYCYYYGRNVEVNYEKAFHFFLLGALDGHLISLYKIGDMYQNGYYVPKNEIEAFHIYERCMQTMTEESERYAAGPVFLRLGNCFLRGKGTEVDYERALLCFQRSEYFLYRMVRDGDNMYRGSLTAAVNGLAEARSKLMEQL